METSLRRLRTPHTRMRPESDRIALNLRQLWQFRDLLIIFGLRDIRLRYRQTALGVIWVVLQPLLGAGILSFVFVNIARLPSSGAPAFVTSYAGLLGWNIFNNILSKSSSCLVDHSHLLTKVFFPRLILPLSTLFLSLVDFGVAFTVMLFMIKFYRLKLGLGLLLLPCSILCIAVLAMGSGLIISALMVTYRDFRFVVPVMMQFLLYISPVAYAASAVPARFHIYYFLNPLAIWLEAFRWSLLGIGNLSWQALIYAAFFSIIVFIEGLIVFKRMELRFADVI